MPAASSQTVGSLVIDLRANVAQLQSDMDQAKQTLTKSSREMSSQMKADMNETRQTLALMRDDFGVGIPRELRKAVASVAVLRDAVLALGPVLFGLGFLNIGLEVFDKISSKIDEAGKKAAEEAQFTRDIAAAAQKSVEATQNRAYELELIGKGEEDRAALQQKHFQDEMTRAKARMASLQAEIAAKIALINLEELSDTQSTDPNQTVGDENDRQEQSNLFRQKSMEELMKNMKPVLDGIKEAQKTIDEAMKGLKQSDDQLFVYEQGLAVSRIKNWEKVADAQVAQQKDAIEKMHADGEIGIDQELMQLRTAATEKYNIQLKALQDTLDVLEQDPSRNKEKIEAIQADIKVLWINYEKDLTDIHALGVSQRKQQTADEARALTEAFKEIAAQTKGQGSNGLGGLIGSLASGPTPTVGGSTIDFMNAQIERFAGTNKDAAQQSKLLEQSMEALLTPTQKFEILQGEIIPLMERYKAYPDAVKALQHELDLANPVFQKLQQSSAEFGKDLSTEMENVILKGESMHDMLQNLLKDLADLILKAMLLKPLEDFFGGTGGSVGGGFPSFLAGIFGGGHAYGGRPSSDQISIVGENGPELFVPDSSGTIVPNGTMGGTVINNYVDARGSAPGMELKMQRALQAAMAQSVQSSVAATIERSRRS